ncbi:carboxypeptidase regulatory-like domain-containing protein [Terracidiphilus gabretensis]|uniref:carboxypeptidase regulatory-like domain-containing protein n=1 Tax=Terracidiphilus gabretensis TaxID=1577687 RepID=UPI00071B90FD|nr:carboxypeptidase regulatory-like domain-containing protein [Terracidiphilus gabretensis]
MGETAEPPATDGGAKGGNKWALYVAIVTVLGGITVAFINRPHAKPEAEKQVSIDGRITDGNGPVISAQVTIDQAGTGTIQVISRSGGDFHADHITATPLTLSVQANGHLPHSEDVNPSEGSFRFLDIKLEPSEVPLQNAHATHSATANAQLIKLVLEFDYRVDDAQRTQKLLADAVRSHSDQVSLIDHIGYLWYGQQDRGPTAPEFKDVTWLEIVSQIQLNGVVKDSQELEDAILAIRDEAFRAQDQRSWDPKLLQTHLDVLKRYSSRVLHPAIGDK